VIWPIQESGDFVSILQDLITEVIPSKKCHMNMGSVINVYRSVIEIKVDLKTHKT
jgi:hypothetical protein